MPKQGLHLITPSAAVATGTGSSATINANGSVTFSTVTGLELRGVFSADYDNYQIVLRSTTASADIGYIRMVSGSTIATASNYSAQYMRVSGAAVTGSRNANTGEATAYSVATTYPNGAIMFFYGPYLSQPTVGRTLGVDSTSSARIQDYAWSHSLSTSYDGFFLGANSLSGLISVYGMRK